MSLNRILVWNLHAEPGRLLPFPAKDCILPDTPSHEATIANVAQSYRMLYRCLRDARSADIRTARRARPDSSDTIFDSELPAQVPRRSRPVPTPKPKLSPICARAARPSADSTSNTGTSPHRWQNLCIPDRFTIAHGQPRARRLHGKLQGQEKTALSSP